MKINGENEMESKLFAFNSKMLLQAMRKIQREMDKSRHGEERDTHEIQWERNDNGRKRERLINQGLTRPCPGSPSDWVALLRVVMW